MEVLSLGDQALVSRIEKLLAVELLIAQENEFMRGLREEDDLSRRDLVRRLARFYDVCSKKQVSTLRYVESMSGIQLDENISVDQSVRFVEALRRCCAPGDDGDVPL